MNNLQTTQAAIIQNNMSLNMYKNKYHKGPYNKPPLKLMHRRRIDNSPSLPVIVNSLSASPNKPNVQSSSPKGLESYQNKITIAKPGQASMSIKHKTKMPKHANSSSNSKLIQQSLIYQSSPVRNIKAPSYYNKLHKPPVSILDHTFIYFEIHFHSEANRRMFFFCLVMKLIECVE